MSVKEWIEHVKSEAEKTFMNLLQKFEFTFQEWASLMAQTVKSLPAMWESQVQSLGWKDPLEEGMATLCSILAWRIPWTEGFGGLWSMGSQRVIHD